MSDTFPEVVTDFLTGRKLHVHRGVAYRVDWAGICFACACFDEACTCRGYHERTGKHVDACPCSENATSDAEGVTDAAATAVFEIPRDYWVCALCGDRDAYGSDAGCPNCGSQDEVVHKSVYDARRRGMPVHRSWDGQLYVGEASG